MAPEAMPSADVLMADRIRPHLISGIEVQMGVFIVATSAAPSSR
ncbi:hypothetical protein [Actinomadura sp. 7K507]|nr:hypothetical protein [Actinomadura sp. 7K507]